MGNDDTQPAEQQPAALPTIAQALAAAKRDLRPVGKTERNQDQGYRFRGIEGVLNAAAPVLAENGITVIPRVHSAAWVEGTTLRGKPTNIARVRVDYAFHGPAGDKLVARGIPGESFDIGDKAMTKAMTVAYRIALIQVLSIPTGEPDPDTETHEATPDVNRSRRAEPDEWAVQPDAPTAEQVAEWLRHIMDTVSKYPRMSPDREDALRNVWAAIVAASAAKAEANVPDAWSHAFSAPTAKLSEIVKIARGIAQQPAQEETPDA